MRQWTREWVEKFILTTSAQNTAVRLSEILRHSVVGYNRICFQVASLSRTQTIMGMTSLLDTLTPKKPVLTFVPQLMVDFSGSGAQQIRNVGWKARTLGEGTYLELCLATGFVEQVKNGITFTKYRCYASKLKKDQTFWVRTHFGYGKDMSPLSLGPEQI